jgi:Ser/Thr protein kinase RdoA (MazF antagonist)
MTLSVVAIPKPSLITSPADIAAHWEIDISPPFERLQSLRNAVFRAGRYVVREVAQELDNVVWEHELLLFLAPRVTEVHAPLRASDGTTYLTDRGRVVSVLPYFDAGSARRSDAHVRAQLPTLLARLHRAMDEWPGTRPRPGRPAWTELDLVHNDMWDWDAIERSPALERAYAETRDWLSHPPALTRSVVHGDFHPENLLVSESRIEAVIDWEFSRLDWPAFDLATAVTVLALQADGTLDERVADDVVGKYIEAGGADESFSLKPLIRLFLLAIDLHGLTRMALGSPWQTSFRAMIETALARFV